MRQKSRGAYRIAAARCLFLAKTQVAEAGVEARQAAAAIDQMLRASGPGRMGGGIDVEVQDVARFPIGGAGEKLGPVGHDHLDQMVLGVNIGFHRKVPICTHQFRRPCRDSAPCSSIITGVAALYPSEWPVTRPESGRLRAGSNVFRIGCGAAFQVQGVTVGTSHGAGISTVPKLAGPATSKYSMSFE